MALPTTEATTIRVIHRAALFGNETEDPFAFLQFAFGDLTVGNSGVIPLVRITNKRYFVSWGEVEAVSEVYNGTSLVSDWSASTGTIDDKTYSYIEFTNNQTATLSARIKGIKDTSILASGKCLEQPDHVIQYICQFYGVTLAEVFETGSWYNLQKETQIRSLTVAGLLERDGDFVNWFTDVLEFLFFVNVEAGRIVLITDSGYLATYPKAYINADSEFNDITATTTLKNISNKITVSHRLNWATRRYDSESTELTDLESVETYGEKIYTIPWKWGRSESIAIDIAASTLTKLKRPQIVIEGESLRHYLADLQYNDIIVISAEDLPHAAGLEFKNAYCTTVWVQLYTTTSKIKYKAIFAYWHKRKYRTLGKAPLQKTIQSVVSGAEFTVDQTTGMELGAILYVNKSQGRDFARIANIIGNTIYLDRALTNNPLAGDRVKVMNKGQLLALGWGDYELGGQLDQALIEQY